jgi:methyl-accepting chemotaxis protein
MELTDLRKIVDEWFLKDFGEVADQHLPPSQLRDEKGVVSTVRPTVVIGLGGSGVKAVTRLKWRIQQFYRGPGFENERRSIAFLVMDTLSYDHIRDEDPKAAPFIYRAISKDDYIYLGGFNPGQYLQEQLSLSQDLQNWWDTRYNPPQVVIEDGAKRVRQLGRLALYRNKERVRTSIRNALNDVVTIHASLVNEGKVRGLEEGKEENVYFYIFSGTCGGTGSGIVLDVVYMCYALAAEMGRIPIIRLVLFMPSLFIEEARKKPRGESLARAYEANAYAFFKELQYLVEAGNTIINWRLDARERQGMDPLPYPGWKPNRIYLIDREIAGKMIGVGEFDQLYTLAADYIFQAIVTPIGFNLEGAQATNIDDALDSRSCGRPNAFSSAGISYIVYPSKTIARSLSSRLLKETLDYLGRTFSDEEKKKIPEKAQDIYSSLEEFLNPYRIDERLISGIERFVNAIPDGDSLIREKEQRKTSAYDLLRKTEEIGENQEIEGKRNVDSNFENFKDDALREVRRKLKEEVQRLIPYGFEMVKGVLSYLRNRVREARSENIPDSPSQAERDAKEAIEDVSKLEGKWLVWKKEKKIERKVKLVAEKVREETDLTIRGYAAEKRNAYLIEIIQLIDEFLDRVRQIQGVLVSLRDEMDIHWRNTTPEYDEATVSITTQLVPFALTPEKLETLYKESAVKVEEFAKVLMDSQNDKLMEAFWNLGSAQESKDAFETFLKEAFRKCIEQIGNPWLSKKVTDVILNNWGGQSDIFRNTYGQNLLMLSDPSWNLDLTRIPQAEQRVTPSNPVCAYVEDGFPRSDYLPQGLQGDPFPGDPRMIVVLRSEHAAPLFAVRGIMLYREVYRQWLMRFQEIGQPPPHINKDWNTVDALEDLERVVAVGREELEAFAHGLFADWLVQGKKEGRLLRIFAEKTPTGPIFRGTRGDYYYVIYEERNGKLYKGRRVSLNARTRYEAAQAIDENAKKAIRFFMDKISDLFSPDELCAFLDEYLDYLKERHRDLQRLILLGEEEREEEIKNMSNENQRRLYKQLLQEVEILKNFREELEEMS